VSAPILGIDPGSQVTGYAALGREGRRLFVVESGRIMLRAADLAARLGRLQQEVEQIIERLQPAELAVEDIFTARNARSALALGQARGVVLGVAGRRALSVHAYPPATVKRAVCGHGRADKTQVQRMVQVLLSLAALPAVDEADAMAIAICHALASSARVPR
jgi:crossover junction endodeoxyribonuclease RuvC